MKKIFSSIIMIGVCFSGFLYFSDNLIVSESLVRTIEIERESINYKSAFDDFEDGKIEFEEKTVKFAGYKTIDLSMLSEVDNLSTMEEEKLSKSQIYYNFSYDIETNIVSISAEMNNDLGEVYIDTITGVGFINEYNEIDAVMNIEGTSVLLSEMSNSGLIQNCGWFSSLIKAIVVVTAGAAAPALVAAGVGVASSAAVTAGAVGVGLATGALFYATIGQAALQAGTAIIDKNLGEIDRVIDKASKKLLEIIVKGSRYAVVLITSALIYNELRTGLYYLSAVGTDNRVYVSPVAVTRTVATIAFRAGVSVYNFNSASAYQVAKDAGNGNLPVHESAHGKSNMTSLYFNHWHAYNHYYGAHAFYGFPVF